MQLTIQRVPALRPIVYARPVALLVLALAAAALLAVRRPRLPAPFGPAANGLIAYDAAGADYVNGWTGLARQIEGDSDKLQPDLLAGRDAARVLVVADERRHLPPPSSRPQPADIRLFVAPVDGRSPAREVSGDVVKRGRWDVAPGWSLDGRRIYFTGMRRDAPLPRTSASVGG